MGLLSRLAHAWNAFTRREAPSGRGFSYAARPYAIHYSGGADRSTLASVRTRIAMDCAEAVIQHIRTDDKGRYVQAMDSTLQRCLTVSANIDQSGAAFRQDVYQTILNVGVAAIVPVETDYNPLVSDSYNIKNLRVGEVTEWWPDTVKVKLYNENTGLIEEIPLPKKICAIVESPLYTIMNEPSGTFQRLMRKLNLLDLADEEARANKLDIIIQLPYALKSNAKRAEAERRRTDIEQQLKGAQYGVAYIDGTEKITQLNRPAENTLLAQIEYLTKRLYTELALTEEIVNGTAKPEAMANYYARVVKPITIAVTAELRRKFLTQTARTQLQDIQAFRDPFALASLPTLADLADKLIRNEVMSTNEMRAAIGLPPVAAPEADVPRNPNMPVEDTNTTADVPSLQKGVDLQNES